MNVYCIVNKLIRVSKWATMKGRSPWRCWPCLGSVGKGASWPAEVHCHWRFATSGTEQVTMIHSVLRYSFAHKVQSAPSTELNFMAMEVHLSIYIHNDAFSEYFKDKKQRGQKVVSARGGYSNQQRCTAHVLWCWWTEDDWTGSFRSCFPEWVLLRLILVKVLLGILLYSPISKREKNPPSPRLPVKRSCDVVCKLMLRGPHKILISEFSGCIGDCNKSTPLWFLKKMMFQKCSKSDLDKSSILFTVSDLANLFQVNVVKIINQVINSFVSLLIFFHLLGDSSIVREELTLPDTWLNDHEGK